MGGLLDLLCQIDQRDKALGQSLRALLETITEMHEKDKAEIERLQSLATIGELVQNMGRETFFWRRFDGHYSARTLLLSKMTRPLLRSDFIMGVENRDPTVALRRIQGEGDVEAVEVQKDEDLCEQDLREQRDGWERGCWEAEQELAKAKAEIERLRPLAEVGELVWGMRNDSELKRGNRYYSVSWVGDRPQYPPHYQGAHGAPARFATTPTMNPAEHLRSIQQEKPCD